MILCDHLVLDARRVRKAGKAPEPLLPTARYNRNISKITDSLNAATNEILTDARVRAIHSDPRELTRAIAEIERIHKSRIPRGFERRSAITAASDIDKFSRQSTTRQIRSMTGVNVPINLSVIDSNKEFISRNTRLLKDLQSNHIKRIRSIVRESIAQGRTAQGLVGTVNRRIKAIRKDGHFTGLKASGQFIARNEVGTYNGQLTQRFQADAGVDQWRWKIRDVEARLTHRSMNNRVFDMGEPTPIGFYPGEDYNCRCYMEPVYSPRALREIRS